MLEGISDVFAQINSKNINSNAMLEGISDVFAQIN